jgi:hypothetical protein
MSILAQTTFPKHTQPHSPDGKQEPPGKRSARAAR